MAPLRVAGTIRVPGDKSISHRALILAALADGESVIRDILVSEDTAATAYALRALGVEVAHLVPLQMPEGWTAAALLAEEVGVSGSGVRGLSPPASPIDCFNSGTTARLLAGVVAGHPFSATFIGDESLSRRPMRRIAEPLTAMGATVETALPDGLPMTVRGGDLRSIEWSTQVASAQVKSALLLAGLASGVRVVVREPLPSRSHTERMLLALGADVRSGGGEVTFTPGGELDCFDLTVPGDPSSAAFHAALAALSAGGSITMPRVCVDRERSGFLQALERFGARVELSDPVAELGSDTATVTVQPGALRAIEVDSSEIPSMIDELPVLACVAARAEGETIVRGAAELRVKESDRIRAIVSNLRAIGADADELPDGFVVRGSARPLRGRVACGGDHRIAMAFGVLGAPEGNDIEIDDRECVGVSYPSFWEDIRTVIA